MYECLQVLAYILQVPTYINQVLTDVESEIEARISAKSARKVTPVFLMQHARLDRPDSTRNDPQFIVYQRTSAEGTPPLHFHLRILEMVESILHVETALAVNLAIYPSLDQLLYAQ